MTKARRSRSIGPLRTWAGDSRRRQFASWLIRSALSLLVLAIGLGIIMLILVPNMIDGLVKIFSNK
jgi:predicted anti-sigma-YlaC factor YlaD